MMFFVGFLSALGDDFCGNRLFVFFGMKLARRQGDGGRLLTESPSNGSKIDSLTAVSFSICPYMP
jgi:hypothetical protein